MVGKKRNQHAGKTSIIITAVVLLNLLGISYAWMEESLQMVMKVFTGSLGVSFSEECTADCGLSVRFEDNNRVMVIEGVVDMLVVQTLTEAGDETLVSTQCLDYEGSVHFQLVNTGTIPAKLEGLHTGNTGIITLDPSEIPKELAPGEDSVPQALMIRAGPGDYEFEIELLYCN
jgi:hypothetical protein